MLAPRSHRVGDRLGFISVNVGGLPLYMEGSSCFQVRKVRNYRQICSDSTIDLDLGHMSSPLTDHRLTKHRKGFHCISANVSIAQSCGKTDFCTALKTVLSTVVGHPPTGTGSYKSHTNFPSKFVFYLLVTPYGPGPRSFIALRFYILFICCFLFSVCDISLNYAAGQ